MKSRIVKTGRIIKMLKTYISKPRRASITVEASILYPMILMLYYSIMCMAFYLHDVNKLEGIMNNTFFLIQMEGRNGFLLSRSGSLDERYNLMDEDEYIEEKLENYLKKEVTKGLLRITIEDVEVNYRQGHISIHMSGDKNIYQLANSKYSRSKSYDFINTPTNIRRIGEWIRMFQYLH